MPIAESRSAPTDEGRAHAWRIVTGIGGLTIGTVAGAIILGMLATLVLGFQVLTVSSGSMEPAINTGDLVVVKPVATDSVSEGDVVVFATGRDRIPTVHRVVMINEVETRVTNRATGEVTSYVDYRFVTKGDANRAPDSGEVRGEALTGKVWFTVPGGGAIAVWPLEYVFGALTSAAVVLWGAWELHRMWRRRRESNNETEA